MFVYCCVTRFVRRMIYSSSQATAPSLIGKQITTNLCSEMGKLRGLLSSDTRAPYEWCKKKNTEALCLCCGTSKIRDWWKVVHKTMDVNTVRLSLYDCTMILTYRSSECVNVSCCFHSLVGRRVDGAACWRSTTQLFLCARQRHNTQPLKRHSFFFYWTIEPLFEQQRILYTFTIYIHHTYFRT